MEVERDPFYYVLIELVARCEELNGKPLDQKNQFNFYGYSNDPKYINRNPPVGSICGLVRADLEAKDFDFVWKGFSFRRNKLLFETQTLVKAVQQFNRQEKWIKISDKYWEAFLMVIGLSLEEIMEKHRDTHVPRKYGKSKGVTSPNERIHPISRHLAHSRWCYFSYKKDQNVIIRAVLTIGEIQLNRDHRTYTGDIELKNPPLLFQYQGKIHVYEDRNIFELDFKTTRGKPIKLYGAINLDRKDPSELILGEMLAYSHNNSIYSADAILQRLKDETKEVEPAFLAVRYGNCTPEILAFFTSDLFRESRVPALINSEKDFSQYLNTRIHLGELDGIWHEIVTINQHMVNAGEEFGFAACLRLLLEVSMRHMEFHQVESVGTLYKVLIKKRYPILCKDRLKIHTWLHDTQEDSYGRSFQIRNEDKIVAEAHTLRKVSDQEVKRLWKAADNSLIIKNNRVNLSFAEDHLTDLLPTGPVRYEIGYSDLNGRGVVRRSRFLELIENLTHSKLNDYPVQMEICFDGSPSADSLMIYCNEQKTYFKIVQDHDQVVHVTISWPKKSEK
ncbi:MAG: hypothetical protein OEM26_05385 [Saprospiraceae bacterium]|nr:hypothetical protein [Saprospiraceae bacterium]